jgi:hypothetical protein
MVEGNPTVDFREGCDDKWSEAVAEQVDRQDERGELGLRLAKVSYDKVKCRGEDGRGQRAVDKEQLLGRPHGQMPE